MSIKVQMVASLDKVMSVICQIWWKMLQVPNNKCPWNVKSVKKGLQALIEA